MPIKEQCGAQPALELLRQFLDHRGWYARDDLQFMKIEDVKLVAAMTSGYGRPTISNRVLRHFSVLNYLLMDGGTMMRVFTTICMLSMQSFSEPVKSILPMVIASVLNVHDKCRDKILPTPMRPHYTFNLRDVWLVFQGISSTSSKCMVGSIDLFQLQRHEVQRVYGDRMANIIDRE